MVLQNSDCLDFLKTIPDNSIDSLITDPPAGISFMGKHWDSDKGGRKQWCAWLEEIMREVHRVLKPGAHGLVWAIPRTSHWTATALEDSGFEIRDVITHLFGSGFPKSLNIKKAGAGEEWDGWGTALKPASEHWILIRKPISEKTVAANVLKWGTGGINIDGCRVAGIVPQVTQGVNSNGSGFKVAKTSQPSQPSKLGRFPANLILDEEAGQLLDEQSGLSKSTGGRIGNATGGIAVPKANALKGDPGFGDFGGASRFFYCAKVSTSERNAGLEGLPSVEIKFRQGILDANGVHGQTGKPNKPIFSKNHHPTVKPIKLMTYLCRLITPPNGTVLDPFMGSGSTGLAAKKEGFDFVGIEKDPDYYAIAVKRISNAADQI